MVRPMTVVVLDERGQPLAGANVIVHRWDGETQTRSESRLKSSKSILVRPWGFEALQWIR